MFKINLLDMIEELKDDFKEVDKEKEASFSLLEGFIRNFDSPIIFNFFCSIVKKERPNSPTILEIFNDGDYFLVLNTIIKELPLADKLNLNQIKFENFSEDQQEIYFAYLKSFFNLIKK